MCHDPTVQCVLFYKIQSNQQLTHTQCEINVLLHSSLHWSWYDYIPKAISDINRAAPGIKLKLPIHDDDKELVGTKKTKNKYRITLMECAEEEDHKQELCWTSEENVLADDKSFISLGKNFPHDGRQGTLVHELLHALGFEHEHQRHDADTYIIPQKDVKDNWRDQYDLEPSFMGLSRFDPFSVMIYPLMKPRTDSDSVWEIKEGSHQCQQLSELDKVGINLLYRPAYSSEYKPAISPVTGIYYCGRSVLTQENSGIHPDTFNTTCGPYRGPNCPACRVLSTEKTDHIFNENKWQGWTGFVYCGKVSPFGINKLCGPDNGYPCEGCQTHLYPSIGKLIWIKLCYILDQIFQY